MTKYINQNQFFKIIAQRKRELEIVPRGVGEPAEKVRRSVSEVARFRPLPIGDQNFEDVITNGSLYVDKTEIIHRLIEDGRKYFLSRPRRFGKSLLTTTLRAVFEGKRGLFQGLAISETDYAFEAYPVVYLNMAKIEHESEDSFSRSIICMLKRIGHQLNLSLSGESAFSLFEDLIDGLFARENKKVVILIDEYDAPVVSQLHNKELVKKHVDHLRDFYSVAKSMDVEGKVRFTFVTGITNFVKGNMFSKLNHLYDISGDPQFAEIGGLTEEEIKETLSDRLNQVSGNAQLTPGEIMERIKYWYNGYRFTPAPVLVYNPMSVLSFFELNERKRSEIYPLFENFWFKTGTPAFLSRFVGSESTVSLVELEKEMDIGVNKRTVETLKPENLQLIPLMIQTGYLTIKDALSFSEGNIYYTLRYPNKEVEDSFKEQLVQTYLGKNADSCDVFIQEIREHVHNKEIEKIVGDFQFFFSKIPYNTIYNPDKELSYQSIVYAVMTLLGFKMRVEQVLNIGRIDATLETDNAIYIIEYKLGKSGETAMNQILEKKYYEPYLRPEKKKAVFLLGLNFICKDEQGNAIRNVTDDWQARVYNFDTQQFDVIK